MKCNPLLVLVAAGFAQLAVANPSEVATECRTPGQVALIIDGLTQANSPLVLASLKEQEVPALFTISQEMLVGQDNFALVDGAKQAGHDLGYRVNIADLSNFSDTELVKELKDVTTRFADIHQAKLAYVLFPYVQSSSMQKRFAGIAKDAGLTAVAHSLYLGSQGPHAKSVIDKDLYHHRSRAYIALLEGHANDMENTLKYYGERMKSNQFKAVSMATCLTGSKKLTEKKLTKPSHHDKKKKNKKTGGVPPHLIMGAARKNGADPVHLKAHKKAALEKQRKKNGILVDPKLIKGFVQKKTHDKKHHHKKDNKPAVPDQKHQQLQDAQKMHAKQNKDFDLTHLETVNVKGDENNKNAPAKKDGEVKQQAVDKEDAAKKDKGNSAGHLSAGATSTMVIAAVAGLLAFL